MISKDEFISLFNDLLDKEISFFPWDEILSKPLRTGEAFEWLIFLSIINSAKKNNIPVSFPFLEHDKILQSRFFCNCILPYQTAVKPGNSSDINLWLHYMSSLLPKAILKNQGQSYSIYKEGFSISSIFYDSKYEKRADFVIASGEPTDGTPVYNLKKNLITFNFKDNFKRTFEAVLQPLNMSKNMLPLLSRKPETKTRIPVRMIIECSHNKTDERALEQLNDYFEHYGLTNTQDVIIVSGNKIIIDNFQKVQLSLTELDIQEFKERLSSLADIIIGQLFKEDQKF